MGFYIGDVSYLGRIDRPALPPETGMPRSHVQASLELERYGQRAMQLKARQEMEELLKQFGYPVGVDFRTMMPIYWTSEEAAKMIVELNDIHERCNGDYILIDTLQTFSDRTHGLRVL